MPRSETQRVDEKIRWGFDWASNLAAGVTITDSTWTADPSTGLLLTGQQVSGSQTSVLIEADSAASYLLTNHVTLSDTSELYDYLELDVLVQPAAPTATPFISEPELRGRLPLDGEGLSDSEVQEAIDAAVEEIVGQTGDTTGESAIVRGAVINLAMADLFDTKIYPQDARRPGTESSALRQSVDRALTAYLKIKTDVDQDPLTSNADVAYVDYAPF